MTLAERIKKIKDQAKKQGLGTTEGLILSKGKLKDGMKNGSN